MISVGINGFGRIGRTVARIALQSGEVEPVAINSRADTNSHAYLLKYDSVHGQFPLPVQHKKNSILVDGKEILCTQVSEPEDIPWDKTEVDVVLESTGIFKDREQASRHLGGTVKKVIVSAPSKSVDKTIVLGVNEQEYNPDKHHIVSNASCTTNALAVVCKVLSEEFGIQQGFMNTIHAVTGSQRLLDGSHNKENRRGRAAFSSIIPTSTGASKALTQVLPELKDKLDCLSLRVPVPDASLIDLTVKLKTKVTAKQINLAFQQAIQTELKDILQVAKDELVSSDYIGNTHSAIIDPFLTQTKAKTAKVFAWYDNEMGYSARLVDLAKLLIV